MSSLNEYRLVVGKDGSLDSSVTIRASYHSIHESGALTFFLNHPTDRDYMPPYRWRTYAPGTWRMLEMIGGFSD